MQNGNDLSSRRRHASTDRIDDVILYKTNRCFIDQFQHIE